MKIHCITCEGHGTVYKRFPFETARVNYGFMGWNEKIVNAETGERVGLQAPRLPGRIKYDLIPKVTCQTCDGTGWITREEANYILGIRKEP